MQKHLLNVMEVKGLTYKYIANNVGCSEGLVYKFIKEEKNIKFEVVLDIVRLLDKDKEYDLMSEYAEKIDKPIHFKVALEYCSTHRLFNTLKDLVDKCRKSKNKNILEWAEVYGILHDWKTGKTDEGEMYEAVKTVKVNCFELSILTKLMKSYNSYKIDDLRNMSNAVNTLELDCFQVDTDYLKKSYLARCYQALSHLALHYNNNPEKARKYSNFILGQKLGSSFDGFAYNILTISYIYESKTKTKYYSNKALNCFREVYGRDVFNSVDARYKRIFALQENAFETITRDEDDPLDMLIQGKVNKSLNDLLKSLAMLKKQGDMFFYRIVEEEIAKYGVLSDTLAAIVNL